MAQRSGDELLNLLLTGTRSATEIVPALFDRTSGRCEVPEGRQLDYKVELALNESGFGELARDIMAFSNSDGGLLLGGVADDGRAIGHVILDVRMLRQGLGPFMGTRIDYDYVSVAVPVAGRQVEIAAIVVPKSHAASPSLLRKTIEHRRILQKKVSYLAGSLFYRDGAQTLVEPPGAALEERAQGLGFSWAAPRTRSSFVLKTDRPLLRLYANINDRLFGRDELLAALKASFDDPRGRGVSIAGLGGIGKTELAIRLVQELHDARRFTRIYSGSAKESLLGATGTQDVDPVFRDLPTFLKDLAAWLGVQSADLNEDQLKAVCLADLRTFDRVLLFVDNLETVKDRRLFDFLENELPNSAFLVLTGRVHRVRNYLKLVELEALHTRPAAQLLRHELKRQGLADLADTPIEQLEEKAKLLFCHPLGLRWFAWACKTDPTVWNRGPGNFEFKELEAFCIAHTLRHLPDTALAVLSALITTKGVLEATEAVLQEVSGVTGADLERSLYELECAGLVTTGSAADGSPVFSPVALAERPAADIARIRGWEREQADRLKLKLRNVAPAAALSATLRDLLGISSFVVKSFTQSERTALLERVDRGLPKCPSGLRPKLLALKAECQRHENNIVTADGLYQQAADGLLSDADSRLDRERPAILLEAATVALMRGHTRPQAERALRYLEAIHDTSANAARVLGMLADAASIVGDQSRTSRYLTRAEDYLTAHRADMSQSQIAQMTAALERARKRAGIIT
jgi:hypothetical protein